MTRKWETLPEWIEIRIPSKNRHGRKISRRTRKRWLGLWRSFLLNPNQMRGKGYEALAKRGGWRGKAIFDPRTGEWQYTVETPAEEDVEVILMYCTKQQLSHFKLKGRALLIQMGRELNQDAVAYADKRGLHTTKINLDTKVKNGNVHNLQTGANH